MMVGSKLPMPILGQIWDLSDIDRDGFLDRYEFTVAMHLVFRALQGDKMPDTLPEELSAEKVPKPLSATPNLNGAPKVCFEIEIQNSDFNRFFFSPKLVNKHPL